MSNDAAEIVRLREVCNYAMSENGDVWIEIGPLQIHIMADGERVWADIWPKAVGDEPFSTATATFDQAHAAIAAWRKTYPEEAA